MHRAIWVVWLWTFSICVNAKELESRTDLDLSSPISTFKTCSMNVQTVSRNEFVYYLRKCFTRNAQNKLVTYLYLGSAVAAALSESDEVGEAGADELEQIVEKYDLEKVFDSEHPDAEMDAFEDIDTINLLYDLYTFLTARSNSSDYNAKVLKDVKVTGNRARGHEHREDSTNETEERIVIFLKVGEDWLVDGWEYGN